MEHSIFFAGVQHGIAQCLCLQRYQPCAFGIGEPGFIDQRGRTQIVMAAPDLYDVIVFVDADFHLPPAEPGQVCAPIPLTQRENFAL